MFMAREAEERVLAKIIKKQPSAEYAMQQEEAIAELELLQWNERIFDWRAVRLASALMLAWERRRVEAENALVRCQKRRERLHG